MTKVLKDKKNMIKAAKLKKLRDSKHYNHFREDLNKRMGEKKKAVSV